MISRRTLLAAGVAAVGAACAGGSSPSSARTHAARRPRTARFYDHGPTGHDRVALTFHTDGDLAIAASILDTLRRRDVTMTAFIVGQWLDANPSWATRIADEGHELANHTYTHPAFSTLPPEAMRSEIERCRDLLERLTGTHGRCFRPSGTADGTTDPGADVLEIAGETGYPVVLGFDVDPLDYENPGGAVITDRVLAGVGPGSIVSLHFGHPGTLEALDDIIDGIEARGLKPVTASKLLGRRVTHGD